MEAQNVLNLLDSYWYNLHFFKTSKPSNNTKFPKTLTSHYNSFQDIPTLATIHTNSPTLEKMTSNFILTDFSSSPNSVLQSPKLQTILSGKQTKKFDEEKIKKKRLSKSLSDLEFEELKGFMDLGFVFSEEDKDSTLASIIPGLQRLRININHNNNKNSVDNNVIIDDKFAVSRPYLSEAWEMLEKKKKKERCPLKWKVPASNNQIDMKDYLKSWAHSVASAVR